ncbi:hypothetical protein D3C86_1296680 [compost metagenome]
MQDNLCLCNFLLSLTHADRLYHIFCFAQTSGVDKAEGNAFNIHHLFDGVAGSTGNITHNSSFFF